MKIYRLVIMNKFTDLKDDRPCGTTLEKLRVFLTEDLCKRGVLHKDLNSVIERLLQGDTVEASNGYSFYLYKK